MLTLTFRLALLFAVVAPAYTTSFHRRQSGVTSNCNHDFAFSWDDVRSRFRPKMAVDTNAFTPTGTLS